MTDMLWHIKIGGLLKHRIHQYEAAQSDFNKGISVNPCLWDLFYYRAKNDEKLNNYQAAWTDYQRATQLKPDHLILKGDVKFDKDSE